MADVAGKGQHRHDWTNSGVDGHVLGPGRYGELMMIADDGDDGSRLDKSDDYAWLERGVAPARLQQGQGQRKGSALATKKEGLRSFTVLVVSNNNKSSSNVITISYLNHGRWKSLVH